MIVPFKVPAALSELGPVLRLQCLFKLVNEKHSLMKEIKLTVAREIFRNIELVNDLSLLQEVELGAKGAAFYADCAQAAVYLERKWQVFAAAVFFRVPRPWVQAVVSQNESEIPG